MNAFRSGFGDIIPISSLNSLTGFELKEMICGEDTIEWTQQQLINHLHPSGTFAGISTSNLTSGNKESSSANQSSSNLSQTQSQNNSGSQNNNSGSQNNLAQNNNQNTSGVNQQNNSTSQQ